MQAVDILRDDRFQFSRFFKLCQLIMRFVWLRFRTGIWKTLKV
jgi:hypothetical protein